jgi:C-terminal processing protease CtpA/Prc
MKPPSSYRLLVLAQLCLVIVLLAFSAPAQNLTSFDRQRGKDMLEAIKSDIKKNYYDPNFHGIDLDQHFKATDVKISQATSLGQMFGIIAQALIEFNDSHLYFLPPGRTNRYDYGWRMAMIGNKCFITAVKPGSDAEAKGVQPGDEIYSIDGFEPTRDNLWKIAYAYYVLRPKTGVRFVLNKPDGSQKEVDVLTKVTQGRKVIDLTGFSGTDLNEFERDEEDAEVARRTDSRQFAVGNELLIWKLAEFDMSDGEVDDVINKARKYRGLIIDLRGNGGGAESTLLRMLGGVFDHQLQLGEIKRRKETKPLIAKTRGADTFKERLVVLIDSQSGSAAELFARTIQLEKRGLVIGDVSAGAVMRARFFDHQSGIDTIALYGAVITDADVIMSDGKSLEHVGVTPDRLMLPAAKDLAAGRDPVLSFAASVIDVNLDPEKAGSLFPRKWKQ